MHCDLDLWPFDLKIYRAHPWLMGSLHVKFHDDRCKGKAVMRRKPFSMRTTDGRTDMVIPVYPPNFVVGGIIILEKFCMLTIFLFFYRSIICFIHANMHICKQHVCFPYFLLIFSNGILYENFMEHSSIFLIFSAFLHFLIPLLFNGFYKEFLWKLESKYSAFLYFRIFPYGEIKESWSAGAPGRGSKLTSTFLTPWSKINWVPLPIIHNLHMKFESDRAITAACIVATGFNRQMIKVDLDLWMNNLCVKFDSDWLSIDWAKTVVSIVPTRIKCDELTYSCKHSLTNSQTNGRIAISPPMLLRGNNNVITITYS